MTAQTRWTFFTAGTLTRFRIFTAVSKSCISSAAASAVKWTANAPSAKRTISSSSELVKKGYINIIVGSLLGHYPCVPAKTSPNIGTVISAINYIDKHYREPLSLERLSAEFGYNKYYVSRLFNLYIGESLNAYINAVRVRNLVSEAKKMENPNLSELVFSNGFDSMTTFYRTFSKYYSRPPREVFREIFLRLQ